MRPLVNLAGNRAGNVAILFAILLVPLLVAAGMGLDMMRTGEVRTDLKEATDAGLLAAARAKLKDDSLSDEELTDIARRHFDANKGAVGEVLIEVFDFEYDASTKAATLAAKGRIRTAIMGVAGRPYMNFDILSSAEVVRPRSLEVVLALDNTGSMEGAKLDSLKSSAHDLVETLMADADNKVKVGLVPFSRHVNIGVSRRNEPWLNIAGDGTWDENACSVDEPAATAAGCSEQASTCKRDGKKYDCKEWVCPAGDPPYTCSTATHGTSWMGCVGSRNGALEIEDRDFLSNPVPGVNNVSGWPDCPSEVFPMTVNKASVLARIDAMIATGATYIPGGLFWAQALISSEEPFTEGQSYDEMANKSGVKAIVLMTDGENTASPGGDGSHYENDTAKADDTTRDLCAEIKEQSVVLYTIAFDVTDAGTLDMLRDCATSPDSFFNASDSAALSSAFGEISDNLKELALTQ